ncbi:hypothetical protein [Roseateles depolymerans]|uniref:Uncharacterized protein n=1 Tax=Roseateles depolymerans TaxID=76731 RepID=A0A0U3L1J0_9BURK|nr:hypothetical protein [Roseateles depolymerans]ALV05182.1 hypothetical protein RD2015_686 [Roseateles depolymerans]REG14802.1 hypothetical protein DES44_3299 [Roseateles depolymerans]
MSEPAATFFEYVSKALSEVPDQRLTAALISGFENNLDSLRNYAETYQHITSSKWSADSLSTFFCGWRSPDGAAHAVSSIAVRLLQEAALLPRDEDKLKLMQAARHCGEIIVEDIGLGELHGHPHHSKLYHRLASAVCGSDAWRLQDRFLNPITKEFSTWVGQKRPLAPQLIEAIEMMIMTELFNTGEYNMMTPMWKAWLRKHYGYSASEVNHVASFLSVHCGSVEARHFTHATEVLALYADATGEAIDYGRIAGLSAEYVDRACTHARKMASVLTH